MDEWAYIQALSKPKINFIIVGLLAQFHSEMGFRTLPIGRLVGQFGFFRAFATILVIIDGVHLLGLLSALPLFHKPSEMTIL